MDKIFFNRPKAFSLVELLISLIIISLVIAAFVPVMTKKFTQTIGLTTSRKFDEVLLTYGNDRKTSLYDCKISEDKTYADCKFIVPEGVSELTAVITGAGGGGASGTGAYIEKDVIASSDNLNTKDTIETQKTITIEDGMKNVVITDLIGGGGGGGSGFYGDTEEYKYIDECPVNTVRIKGPDEAEYCVTKYNVRPVSLAQYHNSQSGVAPTKSEVFDLEIPIPVPENYFNFATGDTPPYYGDYNAPTNTTPACWVSQNIGCSSNGVYSGCGRTVCNWYAAIEMCRVLDMGGKCNAKGTQGNDFTESCKDLWKIPDRNWVGYGPEAIFLRDFRDGGNTLSLCDAGTKAPACPLYSGISALGSYENKAYPAGVWGNEFEPDSPEAALSYVSNGTFQQVFKVPKIAARSVRCVLKAREKTQYLMANGAPGTSGHGFVKSSVEIPNEIIENNIGAKIILTGGKGGEGGGRKKGANDPCPEVKDCTDGGGGCLCANEYGANGEDGEESSVIVQKGSEILWGYKIRGGYHGYAPIKPYDGFPAAGPFSKVDTSGIPIVDSEHKTGIPDDEKYIPVCEKYNTTEKKWETVSCPTGAKIYYDIYNRQLNNGGEIRISSSGFDTNVAYLPIVSAYSGLYQHQYGRFGAAAYAWLKPGLSWPGKYLKNTGYPGTAGVAMIKYDKITSPGVSGGGGGGACVLRLEHVPVKSGDEFKIQIGAGGLGGISSDSGANPGSDGNKTVLELPSVFKITALGGKGGKAGVNSNKNNVANGSTSEVVDCNSVSDNSIPENIKKNIVFLYAGKEGGEGIFKEENSDENSDNTNENISNISYAVGGNGGIAGFYQISGYTYSQGGCGGYSDIGECASKPNKYNYGLSPDAYDPFKLYSGKTYGTFGSGGGGGGWLYDFEKNERAGSGGRGLDGYVYLYWYR